MSISFDGKFKGKADVPGGSSSRSAARSIRRAIRRESRRIRREIRRNRRQLRRDIRRDLFSDRFAEFIRNAVSGADTAQWRAIAESLLNESVQVETTAGPVSGVIIEVGADYMIIRETPGTILVIPFASVVSIQPV